MEEGLTYVKLKGVVLYDQNSKLVRFDSFNISLSPFGLSLSGLCDGKSLYVEWSLGEKRLRLKTLPALEMWKAYREIYLSKMAFMASWR